ncbi:unnamed protein product [Nippostrongylus brasiliensis]|uniref:Uncharacterized protein n=1 Tax=Nippostrongylus brasiliensis TaxID=27835 RepID=A0A0N4YV78_NIPBR|nr:unnamed protein product [Nippostrongylus brasiliensis]
MPAAPVFPYLGQRTSFSHGIFPPGTTFSPSSISFTIFRRVFRFTAARLFFSCLLEGFVPPVLLLDNMAYTCPSTRLPY